jgi:cytoskeletal protein CcmA (bactofilin family)
MFDQNKEENKMAGKNLIMSGAGVTSGGVYDEVRLSGACHVSGDVECNELVASGASKVKGNVKAKTVVTSGASKIAGSVEADRIEASGASEIEGDVTVKDMLSSGSMKIGGVLRIGKMSVSGATNIEKSVFAEEVKISGSVKIGGDCETETFKARGGFKIGGLLNGGSVDIKVSGECKVKEIGGEKIEVRSDSDGIIGLKRIIKAIFLLEEGLSAEIIEGDEIYLESTKAKVVRGNSVTIGQGCDIDVVEFSGELKIAQGAKVREQKKI